MKAIPFLEKKKKKKKNSTGSTVGGKQVRAGGLASLTFKRKIRFHKDLPLLCTVSQKGDRVTGKWKRKWFCYITGRKN